MACSAVVPETGTAAASAKLSRSGFGTNVSGLPIASSANDPLAVPIT